MRERLAMPVAALMSALLMVVGQAIPAGAASSGPAPLPNLTFARMPQHMPVATQEVKIYTVRLGDTLSSIATALRDAWPLLWWDNRQQISNPDMIRTGQVLTVPAASETVTSQIQAAAMAAVPAAAPSPAPTPVAAPASSSNSTPAPVGYPAGIWSCIAQYESGGDWSINTGNGYYGGVQFAASSWDAEGGQQYAPYANEATEAQQITVAERLQASQGWGAWPVSSVKCGL